MPPAPRILRRPAAHTQQGLPPSPLRFDATQRTPKAIQREPGSRNDLAPVLHQTEGGNPLPPHDRARHQPDATTPAQVRAPPKRNRSTNARSLLPAPPDGHRPQPPRATIHHPAQPANTNAPPCATNATARRPPQHLAPPNQNAARNEHRPTLPKPQPNRLHALALALENARIQISVKHESTSFA